MRSQDTLLFDISTVSNPGPEPGLAEEALQFVDKVQIHEPTWHFIYLFILLSIYAWIIIYYGNVMTRSFQASVNFKLTHKLFKNTSLLQNQLDGALYLFYFLSMTFLLYYMEQSLGLIPYELKGGFLFLFNFALLTALFTGRVVLHITAGILFNSLRIVREYLYNMFVFNKLAGLVALPLLFLLVYTRGILQDIMFWTLIIVLLGIVMLRLIRGAVFSYKKDVLIFYMFLYLCALEIVPLVLLYRWLEGIL